ncbi:DUF2235 domain-containing protein [Paraburkholderia bryophila]|uniref:phospholipase effector Tle1 domain-containing protein n=1 Tax=Burkholderiaceae TaxID=119060 RepID=UPI0005502FE6|nr:DUF2235 domain-containing protein [Burkholderia sp. 9120]
MKNIVVFIDGTWNDESVSDELTNVYKLFSLCIHDANQKVAYIRGVGTGKKVENVGPLGRMKLPAVLRIPVRRARNAVDALLGGTLGEGATERIKEAYTFISQHYDQGDQVFLFGFSRGAFIARALAGFIDQVGVLLRNVALSKRRHYRVEEAFEIYWADPSPSRLRWFLRKVTGHVVLGERFRLPIHFLGQWDAVEALTLHGYSSKIERQLLKIANRERERPVPQTLSRTRHALALHELRSLFLPLLWKVDVTSDSQPNLEQRWFAGAHADVGGGYANSSLSDVSLRWMYEESKAAGLRLVTFSGSRYDKSYKSTTLPYNVISGKYKFSRIAIRGEIATNRRHSLFESIDGSAIRRLFSEDLSYRTNRPIPAATALAQIDELTLRIHSGFEFWRRNEGSTPLWSFWLPGSLADTPFLEFGDRMRSFIKGDIALTDAEIRNSLVLALDVAGNFAFDLRDFAEMAVAKVRSTMPTPAERASSMTRIRRLYDAADSLSGTHPSMARIQILVLALTLEPRFA